MKWKQESPPARTQEAYRPIRSKCSLCCSVSRIGGGTLSSPGQGGYPIQNWMGEYHIQSWCGVPHPFLTEGWGYSIQSWVEGYGNWVAPCPDLGWGIPRPDLGMRYPSPDLRWSAPPHPDLRIGYPLSRPGMGYPPSWPGNGVASPLSAGQGYPHPPRKYEQTENITFPHPSDAGGNN